MDELKEQIIQIIYSMDIIDGTFTTVDVIRRLEGEFISNIGTAPSMSPNARVGKIIAKLPNIEKYKTDYAIVDDNGRKTKTTVWKINWILSKLDAFIAYLRVQNEYTLEVNEA